MMFTLKCLSDEMVHNLKWFELLIGNNNEVLLMKYGLAFPSNDNTERLIK
ncbi:hypothetical protein [Solitalea canadensis]|uniref:Uncharacterized protein n=1 Tax=Solitalea canadensis (strain ATCC 29591 / DSM 3403 / JCM 21819 / LMG 8368 / NBRC 15130 / NCIMB 12057 / USAM 9D) TaxID=929556 RepID=H8KQ91_SOLCM|nr:hypothetical protein [Solitalea canadensis]AFD06386.1 hypothetical protein Solca_1297 [Solitalea canadensis DSM 3403]